MTWVVIRPKSFSADFRRLCRRYPGLDRDFERLFQNEVLAAPETAGDRIPGVDFDVRKVRLPIPSQRIGKRGGLRMIFALDLETRTVVPLVLFAKRESENIARRAIEAARDNCREEVRRELAKRGYDPDLVRFLRVRGSGKTEGKRKTGATRRTRRRR